MSQIIKLGAKAITDDMMAGASDDERERERVLSWSAGYYVGLYEADMITDDELDSLTDDLK